jgi:hypothetical protein
MKGKSKRAEGKSEDALRAQGFPLFLPFAFLLLPFIFTEGR